MAEKTFAEWLREVARQGQAEGRSWAKVSKDVEESLNIGDIEELSDKELLLPASQYIAPERWMSSPQNIGDIERIALEDQALAEVEGRSPALQFEGDYLDRFKGVSFEDAASRFPEASQLYSPPTRAEDAGLHEDTWQAIGLPDEPDPIDTPAFDTGIGDFGVGDVARQMALGARQSQDYFPALAEEQQRKNEEARQRLQTQETAAWVTNKMWGDESLDLGDAGNFALFPAKAIPRILGGATGATVATGDFIRGQAFPGIEAEKKVFDAEEGEYTPLEEAIKDAYYSGDTKRYQKMVDAAVSMGVTDIRPWAPDWKIKEEGSYFSQMMEEARSASEAVMAAREQSEWWPVAQEFKNAAYDIGDIATALWELGTFSLGLDADPANPKKDFDKGYETGYGMVTGTVADIEDIGKDLDRKFSNQPVITFLTVVPMLRAAVASGRLGVKASKGASKFLGKHGAAFDKFMDMAGSSRAAQLASKAWSSTQAGEAALSLVGPASRLGQKMFGQGRRFYEDITSSRNRPSGEYLRDVIDQSRDIEEVAQDKLAERLQGSVEELAKERKRLEEERGEISDAAYQSYLDKTMATPERSAIEVTDEGVMVSDLDAPTPERPASQESAPKSVKDDLTKGVRFTPPDEVRQLTESGASFPDGWTPRKYWDKAVAETLSGKRSSYAAMVDRPAIPKAQLDAAAADGAGALLELAESYGIKDIPESARAVPESLRSYLLDAKLRQEKVIVFPEEIAALEEKGLNSTRHEGVSFYRDGNGNVVLVPQEGYRLRKLWSEGDNLRGLDEEGNIQSAYESAPSAPEATAFGAKGESRYDLAYGGWKDLLEGHAGRVRLAREEGKFGTTKYGKALSDTEGKRIERAVKEGRPAPRTLRKKIAREQEKISPKPEEGEALYEAEKLKARRREATDWQRYEIDGKSYELTREQADAMMAAREAEASKAEAPKAEAQGLKTALELAEDRPPRTKRYTGPEEPAPPVEKPKRAKPEERKPKPFRPSNESHKTVKSIQETYLGGKGRDARGFWKDTAEREAVASKAIEELLQHINKESKGWLEKTSARQRKGETFAEYVERAKKKEAAFRKIRNDWPKEGPVTKGSFEPFAVSWGDGHTSKSIQEILDSKGTKVQKKKAIRQALAHINKESRGHLDPVQKNKSSEESFDAYAARAKEAEAAFNKGSKKFAKSELEKARAEQDAATDGAKAQGDLQPLPESIKDISSKKGDLAERVAQLQKALEHINEQSKGYLDPVEPKRLKGESLSKYRKRALEAESLFNKEVSAKSLKEWTAAAESSPVKLPNAKERREMALGAKPGPGPDDFVVVQHATTPKWMDSFMGKGVDATKAPPDSRMGRVTTDKETGKATQTSIKEPGLYVSSVAGSNNNAAIIVVRAKDIGRSLEAEGLGYETGIQGLYGAEDAVLTSRIAPEQVAGKLVWSGNEWVFEPNPKSPFKDKFTMKGEGTGRERFSVKEPVKKAPASETPKAPAEKPKSLEEKKQSVLSVFSQSKGSFKSSQKKLSKDKETAFKEAKKAISPERSAELRNEIYEESKNVARDFAQERTRQELVSSYKFLDDLKKNPEALAEEVPAVMTLDVKERALELIGDVPKRSKLGRIKKMLEAMDTAEGSKKGFLFKASNRKNANDLFQRGADSVVSKEMRKALKDVDTELVWSEGVVESLAWQQRMIDIQQDVGWGSALIRLWKKGRVIRDIGGVVNAVLANWMTEAATQGSFTTPVNALKELKRYSSWEKNPGQRKKGSLDDVFYNSARNNRLVASDINVGEIDAGVREFELGEGAGGRAVGKAIEATDKAFKPIEKTWESVDKAFKLNRAKQGFHKIHSDFALMVEGDSAVVKVGRNKSYTVSKTSSGWTIDGKNVGASPSKGRMPVSVEKIIADSAAFDANSKFFDYRKKSPYQIALSDPKLNWIVSPFYSWTHYALSAPGKEGLAGAILRSEPTVSYTSPKLKIRQDIRKAVAASKVLMAIQGARQEMEGNSDWIKRYASWRGKEPIALSMNEKGVISGRNLKYISPGSPIASQFLTGALIFQEFGQLIGAVDDVDDIVDGSITDKETKNKISRVAKEMKDMSIGDGLAMMFGAEKGLPLDIATKLFPEQFGYGGKDADVRGLMDTAITAFAGGVTADAVNAIVGLVDDSSKYSTRLRQLMKIGTTAGKKSAKDEFEEAAAWKFATYALTNIGVQVIGKEKNIDQADIRRFKYSYNNDVMKQINKEIRQAKTRKRMGIEKEGELKKLMKKRAKLKFIRGSIVSHMRNSR